MTCEGRDVQGKRVARVREHWENPKTVSLADRYLKELEMSVVADQVPTGAFVLDIGCGDGEGTLRYSSRAASVLGIDYSAQMIDQARTRLISAPADNVVFRQEDVLSFTPSTCYDCIISERCLINLKNWPTQEQILRNIHGWLKAGGLYLMTEATTQGRDALNSYREAVGLPRIPVPWHNCFVDLEKLTPLLEDLGFICRQRVDFGLYYFISRVVHPLAVHPEPPRYDSPINRAGYVLQRALGSSPFSGVGAITLFVLEKKADDSS